MATLMLAADELRFPGGAVVAALAGIFIGIIIGTMIRRRQGK